MSQSHLLGLHAKSSTKQKRAYTDADNQIKQTCKAVFVLQSIQICTVTLSSNTKGNRQLSPYTNTASMALIFQIIHLQKNNNQCLSWFSFLLKSEFCHASNPKVITTICRLWLNHYFASQMGSHFGKIDLRLASACFDLDPKLTW